MEGPKMRRMIRLVTMHSYILLTFETLLWKTLLLLIAVTSPGPGYDTSTTLDLIPSHNRSLSTAQMGLSRLAHNLLRWDAVYFHEIARRHYLYEQEWAFGLGFTAFLRLCTKCELAR